VTRPEIEAVGALPGVCALPPNEWRTTKSRIDARANKRGGTRVVNIRGQAFGKFRVLRFLTRYLTSVDRSNQGFWRPDQCNTVIIFESIPLRNIDFPH